jgi:transposase-like protein
MTVAAEWQARPLSAVYAIVFFDAITMSGMKAKC